MAPEGFEEFFNQRRRWMPSTMANVYDLLKSWRHTTKINENISMLYIFYQALLLGSSVVGPGTIFMMMVGSLDIALGGRLELKWCFLINFVPLMVFIVLCYFVSTKKQVLFASILTAAYCLIQMLVLIGLIVQMASEGICFPTTVFFLFVSGTFIGAAIIHPQEFMCLIHGVVYYLAIPTMYMLLMVYAMCNLNVVSWGTREVKQTPTEKQLEEEKEAAKEQKKNEELKKEGKFVSLGKVDENKDGWTMSCGTCCSYICCPHKVNNDERVVEMKLILAEMKNTETALERKMEEQMKQLQRTIEDMKPDVQYLTQPPMQFLAPQDIYEQEDNASGDGDNEQDEAASFCAKSIRSEPIPKEISEIEGSECQKDDVFCSPGPFNAPVSDSLPQPDPTPQAATAAPEPPPRNDLINPHWAELTDDVGAGEMIKLPNEECLFFQDLIDVFLFPLLKDKIKEEKLTQDLLELRNKYSVAFLLLNTIFVAVVFVMQLNMDTLYVPWPCGDDVRIEPLGFVFMVMFGAIMILQIIGMVVHRTSTFFHIMSTTLLRCWRNENDKEDTENMVELAKQMGKVDYEDRFTGRSGGSSYASNGGSTFNTEMDFDGDDVRLPKQKNIMQKINKNVKKKQALNVMSVEKAFDLRYQKLFAQNPDAAPLDVESVHKKLFGKNAPGIMTQQKTMAALKTLHRQTLKVPNDTTRGPAMFVNPTAVRMHAMTRRNNQSEPDYPSSTSGAGIANTQNVHNTRRRHRNDADEDDEPNNNSNQGSAQFNYMDEIYKYKNEKKEKNGGETSPPKGLSDLPEEDYE